MNLVGLMPVRNEDWVLGLSARVALRWCDSLVILDHASSDQCQLIVYDLIREFGKRVCWLREDDPAWEEMRHRQLMLEAARKLCATHIAIIDADEILTGNLLGSIRGHIEAAGANMLMLPGYNLRGGLNRYHSNGVWGNRWFSTAFKDDPHANWGGRRQHHREPHGITWGHVKPVKQGDGGMMHLWGASERRLMAKHALYKVNEVLKPVQNRDYGPVEEIDRVFSWAIKGDLTNGFGTPATWTYADVPLAWWDFGMRRNIIPQLLNIDAEPWQEAEVLRLVAEHGRERFEGLDLFDLV